MLILSTQSVSSARNHALHVKLVCSELYELCVRTDVASFSGHTFPPSTRPGKRLVQISLVPRPHMKKIENGAWNEVKYRCHKNNYSLFT